MSRSTWLWWSSGKDSAWALHRLLDDPQVHVTALVSTVDEDTGRLRMHGTGIDLLELQAANAGLPLHRIEIPRPCSNESYVAAVREFAPLAHAEGVQQMAFGDLQVADVRACRDELFGGLGFETCYPLWGESTEQLAREMLEGGLRALITCVDLRVLDPVWLGRPFDTHFLDTRPPGVDACGEHGEFHTFVAAGPMLHADLDIQCGQPQRDGEFSWVEPVLSFPVDGTLDLHGVTPREVGDLVDDYLDACRARGIEQVRIVHGKGIGALRETVHARLRRRNDVRGFELGGEAGGGWGATIVKLAPPAQR